MKLIEYDPARIRLMPGLPRSEPFYLDSTAYKTLRICRRKYFYKHVLGRVVPVSYNQINLDFGSHYHKFRELLEKEGYRKALDYIMAAKLPFVDPKSKYAFLDNHRLAKTCQLAYEDWALEKKQGKIEVIASEQPFTIEIAPDVWIGGRADEIIRFNNRLWGRDWKSTSKEKQKFVKTIEISDQADRYIAGEGAMHGQKIQGIMFDVAYNAKTVGPELYTLQATRNDLQIAAWLEEEKLNHRELAVYRENDIWPMDKTSNCDYCDYHKVCKSSNEVTMANILKTEYKFQPWDFIKGGQIGE